MTGVAERAAVRLNSASRRAAHFRACQLVGVDLPCHLRQQHIRLYLVLAAQHPPHVRVLIVVRIDELDGVALRGFLSVATREGEGGRKEDAQIEEIGMQAMSRRSRASSVGRSNVSFALVSAVPLPC